VPNETQNDTPTPKKPSDWGFSDPEGPEITIEGKRQEIYLALKFIAVRSIQKDDLETARHSLNAAQIVYEMDPDAGGDPWEGL
jgi:hypothetical protein